MIISVFAFGQVVAQQTATPEFLRFEAATIKPTTSASGATGGCRGIDTPVNPNDVIASVPLGRCVFFGNRLSHLAAAAFDLYSVQRLRGPDWVRIGNDRYDVEAKAENPAAVTDRQLRVMLQNFLVERFKLKFHTQLEEVDGYALVIAKNGTRLRNPKSVGDEKIGSLRQSPAQKAIIAQNFSMARLVSFLTGNAGIGPVAEKTGLQGLFDVELAWDAEAGPSLSTALQEQLSLTLEKQKILVEYFIIDAAEKPNMN